MYIDIMRVNNNDWDIESVRIWKKVWGKFKPLASTKMNPLIVVQSPTKKDYINFIKEVLIERTSALNGIDILVDDHFTESSLLNQTLSTLYGTTREIATQLGYDYTFSIDILFNKSEVSYPFIFKVKGEILSTKFIQGREIEITANLPPVHFELHSNSKLYDTSAVGGTFDHLHDGHKILLSMCVFITKRMLIIGITGPGLLKNKKHAEVLESFATRRESVTKFLSLLSQTYKDDLRYEIYTINDICGPTGYIPDIQALVLSEESAKGGDFVNKYRLEKGFQELDVVSIKVIGADSEASEVNNWEGKLSSTEIRAQIVQKRIN